MALRNRKQIPVCHSCHNNVIHSGSYSGFKLTSLAPYETKTDQGYTYSQPTTGFDNRLVNPENYMNPRAKLPVPETDQETDKKLGKMMQKGWKLK